MDETEAVDWRLGALAWAEFHRISPETDPSAQNRLRRMDDKRRSPTRRYEYLGFLGTLHALGSFGWVVVLVGLSKPMRANTSRLG